MRDELLHALRALPPLSPANAVAQFDTCKVCGDAAPPFDTVDLNKFCTSVAPYRFGMAGIAVRYMRCRCCGFLFTRFFDDWTPQEFATFIYNADYAIVDGEYAEARPTRLAAMIGQKAGGFRSARVLDYGSGAGVFARRLASAGFASVTDYDPFSHPSAPTGRFDLVTCFEVIEHSTDPHATLREIASLLATDGCVLFSTGVQPDDIEERRASWWYVGPRNGHASVFTHASLALLGRDSGLTLFIGDDLLAFCRPERSAATRALLGPEMLPFAFLYAGAPAGGVQDAASVPEAGWHALEASVGETFRWTSSPEVRWPIELHALRPCRVRVSVPVRMEIEPGFLASAQIFVGTEELPVICRSEDGLVAEGIVRGAGEDSVILRTAAPRRPADLRESNDTRPLGLSIRAH